MNTLHDKIAGAKQALPLPELMGRPTLPTTCVIIGNGQKADVIWTKQDFMGICGHMQNSNPPNHFLLAFRESDTGKPRYAKAHKTTVGKRADWAWETITGRAKCPTGIGFYPSNGKRESRWAAMDFDAHDGNGARARSLALAAFELLYRHPELFIALTTSGSDGWHLFVFSRDFHPVEEWTLLLKQVSDFIGVKVQSGLCEIFPNDTRGSTGYGIRAPGTWNPKYDSFGQIAFQNLTDLIRKERERGYPSLYRETHTVNESQFPDREKERLFRGQQDAWKTQFAVTEAGTRHEKLRSLVSAIYRQVGREVAKQNACSQHTEATASMNASLTEHMQEFTKLWEWVEQQWLAELLPAERERFDTLVTDNERDAFRIVRSFASLAKGNGAQDFAFVRDNVARRLGITPAGTAKIREKLAQMRIIEMTAEFVSNKSSKRYRWIADVIVDEPF